MVIQPGADDTFTLHLARGELLQLFAALTYLDAPTQSQRELRGQLRAVLQAAEVTPREGVPQAADSDRGVESGELGTREEG